MKKLRAKRFTRTKIEEIISRDPLGAYFVLWDDISQEDLDGFERCLRKSRREFEIQAFLQSNPVILIQHLGGGHGRWVIPQQKLGSEYVIDFLIVDRSSIGYEWQAVELESPRARMFTKKGDPTKELTHAIRQIDDWRAWLRRNQNYAARAINDGGLGLTDIADTIPGLILIGRRDDIDTNTNERRRQMVIGNKIDIHSYDFLLEKGRERLVALGKPR